MLVVVGCRLGELPAFSEIVGGDIIRAYSVFEHRLTETSFMSSSLNLYFVCAWDFSESTRERISFSICFDSSDWI